MELPKKRKDQAATDGGATNVTHGKLILLGLSAVPGDFVRRASI